MKPIIEFYIIGASEIICKWILMNFFEKLFCEKRENINVFWKENKMKGVNKDALQSGADKYTTKNYITTWIFLLIPYFFSVINGLFKNMHNYQFINHEIRPK